LNNQLVKLVKFKGFFLWHTHDTEDELFLVIKGSFDMHLRDQIITINNGEFIIIPHGVEHCPMADDEVHVLLFEPETTINTGGASGELTKTELDII
jgi:mannose-6-phosphate isomerase-like protein (cupin superfamily)